MIETKVRIKVHQVKINLRTRILFDTGDKKKLIAHGATNLEWEL